MPPRIQTQRVYHTLLPYTSTSPAPSTCSLQTISSISQPHRQFSITPTPQTRLRRAMFEWLNTQGTAFKHHIPGETNYLTRLRSRGGEEESGQNPRPFPNNASFFSESILSEDLRNAIHAQVVEKKRSVREVSVEFGVDIKRVAAVVRLVELEKRQTEQGKPQALPYARAIHEMVPVTALAGEGERQSRHEPINFLPTHGSTAPQIFYPVSESRAFTRVDAGRVFSGAPAMDHETEAGISHPVDLAERVTKNPNKIEWLGKDDNARQVLQPADTRIPHPHMITFERDRIANPNERRTVFRRHAERMAELEETEKKRREQAQARRDAKVTKIQPEHSRFEYHFQDAVFSPETTGKDGRAPWAPGRRYGVPRYDRTRGTVKIPTRVDV